MSEIHQRIQSAIQAVQIFVANNNPTEEIDHKSLKFGACGLLLDEGQSLTLEAAWNLLRQRSNYFTDADRATKEGVEIAILTLLEPDDKRKEAILKDMIEGRTPAIIKEYKLGDYLKEKTFQLLRNGQTDRVAYLSNTLRPFGSYEYNIHNALEKRLEELWEDDQYEVMESIARKLVEYGCVTELFHMLEHKTFNYVISNPPPPQNDDFSRMWNRATNDLVFEMTGIYPGISSENLFQESKSTQTLRRIVGQSVTCIKELLKSQRHGLVESHVNNSKAVSAIVKGALLELCAEGNYDPALQFLDRNKDKNDGALLVVAKGTLSDLACTLYLQQTPDADAALERLTSIAEHFDTREQISSMGQYWYQKSWMDRIREGIKKAEDNGTKRMTNPTPVSAAPDIKPQR